MMSQSRVIYFEIPAKDPERCMEFYRQVFDWQFSPLEDGNHWLTRTGPDDLPGINGSITTAGSRVQHVINTLNVKDLQRTQMDIEQYGGEVLLPYTALPQIGWLLYFKDTEGNLHGALQADASAK